ncbi:MAG: hypothetical protein AUJ20_01485 [Comamonadaceae bacterium CG1_02_60_18]|nr:MAG: hypothetical protein AUJ20_01485 [Comamonadaceae bacterium CG1_02_60_18]PIQ50857.1 MAG: hypothetical protein COW02_17680 [Comamonadaceae bacterium CG12_big_fil_rev_8_21_14_0_65_59_15]
MKDKTFWLRLLKLVIWTIVLITLIGLGLYYTAKYNTYEPPSSSGSIDWGISRDSPIRRNR